jgi:hypothetical protein
MPCQQNKTTTIETVRRGIASCTMTSSSLNSNNTRGANNAYKLVWTKERRLFRKKARQLDEEASIEIERHRSIQDSRKFHKRLNDVRRPLEPQVAMCRAKNGEFLMERTF